MNLAIRQIENNLGKEHADSFHRDLHPDLKADYVLANPPFNDSDWRGETLFIDTRKLGTMIDRVHHELTEDDIRWIADTYHAWRGDKDCDKQYEDIPGFFKAATIEDIRKHGHILTPGRYDGAAEVEDDGEPFEEKMARLTAALHEQTEQSAKLDQIIWANLRDIGYDNGITSPEPRRKGTNHER